MTIWTNKITSAMKLVIIVAIISVIIVSLVSTIQLDLLSLILEIQNADFLSAISNIVVGEIGVVYYFILPGLPLIVAKRNQEFIPFCITLTVAIIYSATASYVSVLILMLVGHAELSGFIPLILILFSSLFFIGKSQIKSESSDEGHGGERSNTDSTKVRFKAASLIVPAILVLFLFLRLVIFSNLLVEWSDGLEYNRMISDMTVNNYLLNEYHSRWAPAFPLFGFLVSQLDIPTLVSLKAVSFFFGIVSVIPMLSIFNKISGDRNSRRELRYILLVFWCYPWMNILGSVNLQDMVLTFFVISFVAIIINDNPISKVAAGFSAGLAFCLRYSLGILGPLGLAYILVSGLKQNHKVIMGYLGAWLAFVVPWITRNLLVAGVFLSRTDEGLIDPGNITSNLSLITQSEIFNILSLMGLLPIILCTPLVFAFIVQIWKTNNRISFVKQFFSKELVLLYSTCILQLVIIFMFETPQMRFMLSIGWMFPILWITFANYLELIQIRALIFGWIFWCFFQATYFLRTYWYLIFTRFPIQEGIGSFAIRTMAPPSINNWILSGLFSLLFFIIPFILTILDEKQTTRTENNYGQD